METAVRTHAMLCGGTGCMASGTMKVKAAMEEEFKKKGIQDEAKVVLSGCNGFCAKGPVMSVHPDKTFYQDIEAEDVPALVEEHFLKGRPYQKLTFKEHDKKVAIPSIHDIPFFKHQVLVVLKNKGLIDPERIEDYIMMDGYKALARALTVMKAEEILQVVSDSGLRGRGGAGFPTGKKWEACAKADADQKYMLCNGSAAIKDVDRALMEGDPHAIIEGMVIGARAIGASKGYIYVRTDYSIAVSRLQKAINQCYEAGLLGKNILNSGFDFDLELYRGGGAFICGESTALMSSLEGRRGTPRVTSTRSTEAGLWNKPTILNNVETLANIPQIVLNGAGWYRSLGTEKSAGTKVFALTGAVNNSGQVEVPMDTTLRKIIFDIGGGMTDKRRKFKAVHLGGPSGACIPESYLDMPVTYEEIQKSGAIIGSGGMVVMDTGTCMVSSAKFFLAFTSEESCGKCTPCRVGTRLMHDVLTDICEGRGKEGDIEMLEEMSDTIMSASLCGLGQSAPNPVLSTIRHFRQEYESHINDKWCRAGVCRDISTFYIDEKICKGCGACMRACPSKAIEGEKKSPHKILQDSCLHCRTCVDTCKFDAIKILPLSARTAGEADLQFLAGMAEGSSVSV